MRICDVSVYWFFVFFFKQKTAYEMRMSDWSSDVCSSDLAPAHRYRFRLDGYDDDWVDVPSHGERVFNRLPAGRYQLHVQGADAWGNWVQAKIGRASCRERVCQYV